MTAGLAQEHDACRPVGVPRLWLRDELAAGVLVYEYPDEPGGWRKLPPGYAIPGMTSRDGQPISPLCGHASQAPRGWDLDCDALAQYARPSAEGSEEYACARHAAGSAMTARIGSPAQWLSCRYRAISERSCGTCQTAWLAISGPGALSSKSRVQEGPNR